MTASGFTTALWFDGQAEEAAKFYVSVFDDAAIGRIGHYSEAGPGEPGSVLSVEFTANGQKFVGINGGPQFTFDEAISFQIHCADQAEVDHYWDVLTADGGAEGPCGWLKDRFGLSWQVVPAELLDLLTDADSAKAARTAEVMFAMKKLDLSALKRAHAGG
ncbi:VOC family protein [Streptomyces sp. NBC_01190]|uniref:VOC family protein n=1 Tax=Streptomyces sp. NBC_01190 TaxID=2903767 RepID=UPI003866C04F|nr:VOC family protein [Streptomyces sp. NBC_01190]